MNPIILIGAALVGVGVFIGNSMNKEEKSEKNLTPEPEPANNSPDDSIIVPTESQPNENELDNLHNDSASGSNDSAIGVGIEETPNSDVINED